jgi:hypothetical protein
MRTANVGVFYILFVVKCEKLNLPFDGKLRQHDITYYTTMREEKEFKIDHARLQQYFPLDVVLNGIFEIYQVGNLSFVNPMILSAIFSLDFSNYLGLTSIW